MATISEWRPESLSPDELAADLDMLADVLHATGHAGGSVSFVLPGARGGTRRVMVARVEGHIVGTVQLDLATPPNQPHRAEVLKMMVHPDARRQGIARALMLAVEDVASSAGRTLLTLDTVTGGRAESLYSSLGYVKVGVIPGYALPPRGAELESTTIMYKKLFLPDGHAAGRH